MIETSARLLALLGLLQSRNSWSGPELAQRLEVQQRTVRNDIARLRALGYPIDAVRGPAGGYSLGNHGKMPPLLLEDDEAVAVAVGLNAISASPGVAESSALAIAKLEHVLPERLRRRVRALADSTDLGPTDTATNMTEPVVDPAVLADLAGAIRDQHGLRFFYGEGDGDGEERVEADPYRLVSWQQRWYVVARVRPSGTWRSFRVDWMTLRTPGAGRFPANPLAGGDYSAFVLRESALTGWKVHARVLVDAPAAEVLSRIHAAVGVVETIDSEHCVLVTGADTLETVAVWIGMLGLDFHVTEPPELVGHLRVLGHRYLASIED